MNSVLVIDDDENYRELVMLTLQDHCGAGDVLGFASGRLLLEHLARSGRGRVALVLLDLHMPGMSGLELMAQIRKLDAQVPVAVLSGAAGADEREACVAAGACAFVQKPVAYAELVRALQAVVGSPAVQLSRGGSA